VQNLRDSLADPTAHAATHAAAYSPKYRVIDAFCGAGGLSLGLSMTGRFETILGIDILPEAIETFKFNHRLGDGTAPEGICADMRGITEREIFAAVARFGITGPGQIDCLIGGPPCEGFSQNRTHRHGGRTHKFIDDERNWLFRWFVALAAALQPRVLLIENVPDMVRHRNGQTLVEVFEALHEAGYEAEARILHAADYGVPQMRRRAFFLARGNRFG